MYVFSHLWLLHLLQRDKKHSFVYDMNVDVMLPKEQRNYEEGDMERDRGMEVQGKHTQYIIWGL